MLPVLERGEGEGPGGRGSRTVKGESEEAGWRRGFVLTTGQKVRGEGSAVDPRGC